MKFFKKNNFSLIIVDVSASTGAFVRTVCLIAVPRSVSGQTAIRQTIPTKAPVEAETSTIINKRLFFKEFHFELARL